MVESKLFLLELLVLVVVGNVFGEFVLFIDLIVFGLELFVFLDEIVIILVDIVEEVVGDDVCWVLVFVVSGFSLMKFIVNFFLGIYVFY